MPRRSYFLGCGSERLFGQMGLATQAMLYHVGVQIVLPPGYLCCGNPQTASGDNIVVEIAKHVLGEDWLPEFVKKANAGGIERVLL